MFFISIDKAKLTDYISIMRVVYGFLKRVPAQDFRRPAVSSGKLQAE